MTAKTISMTAFTGKGGGYKQDKSSFGVIAVS